MSRLHLLMLNFEFPPIGGGGGNAHYSILKEYANNDHLKIDVLTSAPRPGFFEEAFSENITLYKVGVHKKSLYYWRKIEVIEWLVKAGFHYRRMICHTDYDLVHAFFGFPTGWLCFKTSGQVPYVISLRGSDVPGQNRRLAADYKLLSPLFKAIWSKASALIASSEGLRSRALRFLPSVAIDVIPNGVDVECFYPPKNIRRSDVLRLITVGRLSVTKRLEMLIHAVDLLIQQDYRIRFFIVGGGAEEKSLRRVITEYNLTAHVTLMGWVDPEKVPSLYRDSDLYVSATMQEGMSNAVLEAMASGLPLITTRCEGVEELIGANGVVVEPDGAEPIAMAMKELADDPERCERMSLESRKKAEQFTWKHVADAYLLCYRNILDIVHKSET
ncbi:MAG: glycosyltransferase family 4 protein [Deltaproteobacteria bacterium]|nr:glycosyltransferase family 4 protein [Deltaproteobacteria bacterium]